MTTTPPFGSIDRLLQTGDRMSAFVGEESAFGFFRQSAVVGFGKEADPFLKRGIEVDGEGLAMFHR